MEQQQQGNTYNDNSKYNSEHKHYAPAQRNAAMDRLIARLVGGAIVLALVCGIAWGVWVLTETYVSPDATRVWALALTIATPLAYAVGWKFGNVENRGKLAGIDDGLDRVTRAAYIAVDARQSQARAIREAQRDAGPVVMLPNPNEIITMHRQIESGERVEW